MRPRYSGSQHVKNRAGFTLAELLVAVAVLTILILFLARLFDSAAQVTTSQNKRMDDNAQARPVFDRMAVDFAQIVQRSDVIYYFKSPTVPQTIDPVLNATGNDQIAFYSQVVGYYPSPSYQSPVSLVGYRVNSDTNSAALNKLERLGKGLHWNGVSTSYVPVVFSPLTIADTWPTAANSAIDTDYELIGPQVFRLEYGYLLKSGVWATSVSDFQTVAAIPVTVALIDPKSRAIISDGQLGALAGEMADFSATMQSTGLVAQWQSTLNTTNNVPRNVASAIRIYTRLFAIGR
jgi:prepilin-type N-terminal cleavage/methylation domain-containing protein